MDNVVNIDALTPGMVIVKITEQNGPIKIRKSGLVTSMEMVTGLAEMGVQKVEIDPAQTVEIERPKIQKSQTQELLESDRVSAHGADAAVSDQFNRSLFLPSVQALPSRWQYYTTPIAQGLLVVLLGFALGWGAALTPRLVTKLTMSEPETSLPVALPEVGEEDDGLVHQKEKSTANKALETQVNAATPKVSPQASNNQDVSQTQQEEGALSTSLIDSGKSKNTNSETMPATESHAEPEREPEPRISPDLLKRFEKAITELDKEPAQPFESTQTKSEDTPRIDQLPAWVLTQLPPMVFSTHMYASSAQDRWVKVNGKSLHEGDVIDEKVRIVHIEPQHVILNYQGQTFSMSALSEW
ncbi:General secretion pathway protein B [Paraglaciecola mesophila]|uniref:General secretion pathway protein B n=1 Tax=Paraglaciecola mesophila TaxID=197222 RepID=A0A857JQF5_9ALTE|nr:general secretion pathway protein GspB [Paraglaciecola mesophila]QHJ13390.1 General secretion pathway protein B [Paraglaciecola mesophila]